MDNQLNIDEYDILHYIFFKELLNEDKIKYIVQNEEKLELLKFYKWQKEIFNESIKKSTKQKIASKIPDYRIE